MNDWGFEWLLLLTRDSLRAPGLFQVLRIDIHAVLSEGERTGQRQQVTEPHRWTLTLPRLSALFSRGAIVLTHTTQTPGLGSRPQAN